LSGSENQDNKLKSNALFRQWVSTNNKYL
jgi:hypothetical protein